VLPQALRMMLPSFINQWVTLVKDSSLAYIVGVGELSFVASQVNARTMVFPAEIFMLVGAIYWLLCTGLDRLANGLARRAQRVEGERKSFSRKGLERFA
jgi:polar amino acid transport system permease protein